MRTGNWVAFLGVLAAAISACGDDFEPCDNCGAHDASTEGSGASGGAAGSAGVGGSAGSAGGAAGVGAGGSGASDAGDAAVECTKASDCGDGGTLVCNPETKTCTQPECTDTIACPSNERCFFQNEARTIGVCFPKCLLAGPACANGDTCIPHWGGPEGSCVPTGTKFGGQECEPNSINTGCELGYRCTTTPGQPPQCKPTCDTWGGTLPCTDGSSLCFLGSCLNSGDGADIGLECALDTGASCAPLPQTNPTYGDWTGICLNFSTAAVCYKLCRVTGSDCTGTETCTPLGTGYEIGFCS
jgi:hypothetical protein